ncbi:MAG TPA: DUF1552 domain-containing protein [Polyangiaceae bacterium]|nr:DUF1552 domain-containing protein [Polyangiaceae bacterium]
MSSLLLNRRRFLQAALAGAASVPLVRALEGVSRASGPNTLQNFICIYHMHGIAAEYWALRSGETETSYDITYDNCSLQPFDDAATYGKSFKDKLLVVEGLDHLSNANGHDSAGTILTGSRIANQQPQNSSLDQFLAVEKGLGASTPVTSISLGVGNDSTASGWTLSFGTGGAPLPKIIDPVQAFNTLFGNIAVPSDPMSQAAAAHKLKVGQSIIDFVTGDIGNLRKKLGPTEQQKLDQHLTSLRELEKRLQPGMAPGSCTIPSMPDASKFPSIRQYNGGEPYFDAITDAHIDLIANAIACGVTHFATLYMNDLSYAGNPLGLPADNHANVAHTYNASPIGDNGRPGDGDPNTWVPLAKFNRYSYGKIARLMQKLDALGALDNTLIYAASDMGNPSLHSTQNVPTVLCGGAGGAFKMGRHIRLGPDCSDGTPWCAPGDATFTGVSNNHLLISIAQAFGVQIDTFGTQVETKHDTGELSELTG